MAETNLTHDQEMHVESHAPYIKVFLALAVFTAIEYFYARVFKDAFAPLVLGLMFWAVIKASMVGWYFMHLKFEGRWVYYMLVPAGILACVFIFALMPDIAMQPVDRRGDGRGRGDGRRSPRRSTRAAPDRASRLVRERGDRSTGRPCEMSSDSFASSAMILGRIALTATRDRSYRLGIAIVLATVLASLAVCLALVGPTAAAGAGGSGPRRRRLPPRHVPRWSSGRAGR